MAKIISGINDLATLHPHLLGEWSESNTKDPSTVGPGSHYKASWKCHRGHEWFEFAYNRINKNTRCPYCAGKRPIVGETDLATVRPDLAAEWSDRNTIKPYEIKPGSGKKVWWKCSEGHEWETPCTTRHSGGNGCPYCAGQWVISGVNDMETLRPDMALQWSQKNALKASEVFPRSNRKYWWICSEGHEWEASASNLSVASIGCPYCANRLVLPGFNDLATTHPDIASEIADDSVDPSTITRGHDKKVKWVCSNGHRWEARVYCRTGGSNTGCPKCAVKVSNAERELQQFVESLGFEPTYNSRSILKSKELDIYIPERSIAIEFNGVYFHSERHTSLATYHYDKWKECYDLGIQLITIWEDDWTYRQEIVKSMLIHKLGKYAGPRVFARNTIVDEVPSQVAEDFMDKNHIGGVAHNAYNLGLIEQGNLVAVMALSKSENILTIDRYATSTHVIGGYSKLISYIKKNMEFDELATFADLCVSDGDLYEKSGWTMALMVEPDYRYVVKNRRVHKSNYSEFRFESDPLMRYEPNMQEVQLAKLNGLYRIWDCGKIKYTLSK